MLMKHDFFYKLQLDKSLVYSNEHSRGGKRATDRLTVMPCANMTGTDKLKVVIRKSAKPRCFQGVKSLPVTYSANKSALMTSEIFRDWLSKWDRELK